MVHPVENRETYTTASLKGEIICSQDCVLEAQNYYKGINQNKLNWTRLYILSEMTVIYIRIIRH